MVTTRDKTGRFVSSDVVKANGKPKTVELGVSHKRQWGRIDDEFLTELRGRRGIRVYREMSDNDDSVGALLFGVEMLIRQIQWPVMAGGEEQADLDAALFVEECRDDMTVSWTDFVANVLTFLPYGWSLHEIVYKERDDGRVGWKKFAYQPQEALHDFTLDDTGGLETFQWTAGGLRGEIPVEKFLLFRTTTARGPTGRSILRNAYRSWYMKKHLETMASIGAERDANGVLIARVPADSIIAKDEYFEAAKDLVTRYKRDEQSGFVFPQEFDDAGNPMFALDVMRSDGASSLGAIRELIQMYGENIAGVVLADFVRLGRTQSGSRALAEPKQALFQKALQGWVDSIADVLNRYAIPRLFELNDIPGELPYFKPEEVEDLDLGELGMFLRNTGQAGMEWFDDPEDTIIDELRQRAGLEPRPSD